MLATHSTAPLPSEVTPHMRIEDHSLRCDTKGKTWGREAPNPDNLRFQGKPWRGLGARSPMLAYGGERVRTDDPLLAKQVLSQLSYTPKGRHATVVGQGGFEPPTPRLSSVCSNQLSY